MNALSNERWREINDLLDEVLDLDSDARAQRLARVGAEDAELRRAVERLLRADAGAPTFLEAEAAEYAEPLLPVLEDDMADLVSTSGERLGAYRIDREIARGGMGRVFLAERADGEYVQKVALKVLRPGLDAQDAQDRFRIERQVLATLGHPNIARLLDGGVTEDGRPYLAMEYVEGRPIDRHCDEERLPVEERLHLFRNAAEAVQHAHRNLVVHRDLKPSNIFVTPEGEVKLLDFGIAKLLDESEGVGEPLTRTGQRWLTPEYAAPEQVSGAPITTATDVYQLGVVLYELLTGRRPFERDAGSIRSIEQAVLQTEPDKPSAAVSRDRGRPKSGGTLPTDPALVSEVRRTHPDRLRRTLQGDLDTIVLKALRKDPEERYASVEAFVDDIKRHLAGLPVTARKPTAAYRVQAFVRRHKVGVAATATVAMVLIGSLGVALWQARVANAERDQAETIAVFLEDLLSASDPFAPERRDTLRVGALITRGQAHVEAEWEDRPLLQARMLHVIGRTQSSMLEYGQAEQTLERALAIRRAHLGERHEATARTMRDLGIARGQLEGDSTAIPLLRYALAVMREQLHPTDPELSLAMMYLARVLIFNEEGGHEEAETLLREALSIQRSPTPQLSGQAVYTFKTMAEARLRVNDFDGAVRYFEQAMAVSIELYGAEHPRTADIHAGLSFPMIILGRAADAERHARSALAVQLAIGADTALVTNQTRRTLAAALRAQQRYDEAEAILRGILTATPNAPDRVITMGSLATLLRENGELAAAESLQQEVVVLVEATIGAEQPVFVFSVSKLSDIQIERRRYAEAERVLLRSLRSLQAVHGDDHSSVQQILEKVAALYDAWRRPDQADSYRALLTPAPREPVH